MSGQPVINMREAIAEIDRLTAERDELKRTLQMSYPEHMAEVERLTALHVAAAARAEVAQIRIEELRRELVDVRKDAAAMMRAKSGIYGRREPKP